SGEVQHSQAVHAGIIWEYNSTYFQFSPEDTQLIIDLSQIFIEERPYDPTDDLKVIEIGQGASPDTYELTLKLDHVEEVTEYEPEMRFHLDGSLIATVPLTIEMVTEDMDLFVHQNLSLQPGWHDINVSVWGKEYLEGGASAELPSQVRILSLSYLVLSEVNDLEPWMPLEADTIIIPEGVTATVDLGEPRTRPARGIDTVHLMGWNGSGLVMDGSALEGLTKIDFELSPQVSLSVENAKFASFYISEETSYDDHAAHYAPITLRNVSAGSLGISSMERDISFSGLRVQEYLQLRTRQNSNVSLSNSVFDMEYGSIEMWNGTLSITDCTFSSNWSSSMILEPSGADVDVSNCTFSGTSLMVFFNNWYGWAVDNINVTGCTFTGAGALLYMGWDILDVDTYDVEPEFVPQMNGSIEGNSFSGEGSGVVLHHGTVGQLYGDNDLSDGARLYAFYITRLQVIPPDGTPFWGAYDFVPSEGMIPDWPFGMVRWIELDGELLYDVTDDITKETHPPILDVILYSKSGSYRIVRGFSQVVPNEDNDEVTYPVYPSFNDLLMDTLLYWPPLEGQE
ncbi:MAG: right-handed parallel beta-helix repeat-containing protein, partial [Thermoplasmata archaeon]|nr:right-handed parallel beta-helix repeat-containing protein [Thermoplasmata archaeon]